MIVRLLVAVFGLATVAALVSGCDPLGRPSLESAFGARVLDGRLHVWTGAPCHDVIEFGLTFDDNKQDTRAELLMNAPNVPRRRGGGTGMKNGSEASSW